jgi:hypothetical protein
MDELPRAIPRSEPKWWHSGRIAEVLLIALGVFLGMLGEEWRQDREHRKLAQQTLHRFRTELAGNRNAVASVEERHAQDLKAIQVYLRSDSASRKRLPYPFRGTNPSFLQYAAWDVALATQSLEYLDRDLATAIAQVYAIQRQLDDATRGITQVMYAKAGSQDVQGALAPFAVYFGDCTILEPRLKLKLDTVVTRIDRALKAGALSVADRKN